MSGAPPPQPVTCDECSKQKKERSESVKFKSKTEKQEKKGRKGNIGNKTYKGEGSKENIDKSGQEKERVTKETFYVCQSIGCTQRKIDRWEAREWVLRHDPELDNSPEVREWEKQRINDNEERLRKDKEDFSTKYGTKAQDESMNERNNDSSFTNDTEADSSRREVVDSEKQSSGQSRTTGSKSPSTDGQESSAATGWDDTPDNNDTAWSSEQAAASGWSTSSENDSTGWGKDTNANDQGATATAGNDTSWGNPRESDTTGTTNSPTDPGDQTETTSSDNAFEQSVYGDTQTDSQGSTLANESPKGEDSAQTNTEAEAERYNNSRSRNRSR